MPFAQVVARETLDLVDKRKPADRQCVAHPEPAADAMPGSPVFLVGSGPLMHSELCTARPDQSPGPSARSTDRDRENPLGGWGLPEMGKGAIGPKRGVGERGIEEKQRRKAKKKLLHWSL